MHAGYLILEEYSWQDGVLHVRGSRDLPDLSNADSPRVFWVGRSRDIDAALMHAQNYFCRTLLDIDKHIYRIGIGRAIAAMENDQLIDGIAYTDDNIPAEEKLHQQEWAAYYRKRSQRVNAVISVIKVLAIGFLLINLVFGF